MDSYPTFNPQLSTLNLSVAFAKSPRFSQESTHKPAVAFGDASRELNPQIAGSAPRTPRSKERQARQERRGISLRSLPLCVFARKRLPSILHPEWRQNETAYTPKKR
jgi:hypothetical protein